jgi:cellulose synthase/poly-beta-1,6-N-acetylglucosamine synthase-like glycosyltransferase
LKAKGLKRYNFLVYRGKMNIQTLAFGLFLSSFIFVLVSSYLDFKRKKPAAKEPFISVIIPTYNDAETVEESIKSVYDSYDPKKFEIIVINDGSKDNTAQVLNKISKRYKIKIVTNKINLGKVASLNKHSSLAKGEYLLFLDSDTLLNKKAIRDLIRNLQHEKVAAATCRYKPLDKGFWARMQELEYGMDGLIQTSYNVHSSLTLWGGCFLIKKRAFEQVGKFSLNMLTEDLDLAIRLRENGWKTKESHYYVYSHVPTDFKTFCKQKMRWNGGFGQMLPKHFKTIISHPIVLLFVLTYVLLTISFVYVGIKYIISIEYLFDWFNYFHAQGRSLYQSFGLAQISAGFNIFQSIALYFLYPLFSLPYVFVNISSKKEWYKILLIFPFSIVYIPIYGVLGVVGIAKGLWQGFSIKETQRAW